MLTTSRYFLVMHGEWMKFGHNGTCIYNIRDFKAKTGGSRNLGQGIVKIGGA